MSSQSEWIPKTKFYPPLPLADDLPRDRLLDVLRRAVSTCRLTLISAPAGSGKTTLVSQFVSTTPRVPCAWLRLGPEDNETAAFLTSLITSVQRALPGLGQRAARLLHSLHEVPSPWRQVMGLLINDLLASSLPVVLLVLDDYHHIENPDVHEACTYLIDNMPPNLHLIVTTRVDPPLPLARLRLRGELAELHLAQLRFSLSEIAAYFKQQQGLDLTPGELDNLQRRTEGWVASLRLLAMASGRLSDAAQRHAFIGEFSRSNRLIFQLLAEEVLAQQPAELRDFLLQTSILSELTPALCTAVTGNPQAPQLLAEAHRRNLFLTVVDDPLAPDVAYHFHDLFASFLRRRLAQQQPESLPELHHRAALAHPDRNEKVRHFLEAGALEEAVDVLEAVARGELQRQNVRRQTCDRILDLPEAVRGSRTWLLLTLGAYYAQRGNYAMAGPYFDQVEARLRVRADEEADIELLFARAWMVGSVDDDTMAAIEARLAAVPHLVTPSRWATFYSAAEWHYHRGWDWPNVRRHVEAGVNLVLQTQDDDATAVFAQSLGPNLLFADGGMAAMERLLAYLDTWVKPDDLPVRLSLCMMQGWVEFYQARPDTAYAACRTALSILQQTGPLGWRTAHLTGLEFALLRWRQQVVQLSARIEETLAHEAAGTVAGRFAESWLYYQGEAALQQGRLDVARHLYQRMAAVTGNYYFGLETRKLLSLLAGEIAVAEGRASDAEAHFKQAARLQEQVRNTLWAPHPRLSLAQLYYGQGQVAAALVELTAVLADIERFATPGMLLQEGPSLLPLLQVAAERGMRPDILQPALGLLAEAGTPHALEIPDSVESLSPREVEVLHLLDRGASNRQIAEELVITERTAKAHVSSILAKLDVSSRGAAVARARSLHLL